MKKALVMIVLLIAVTAVYGEQSFGIPADGNYMYTGNVIVDGETVSLPMQMVIVKKGTVISVIWDLDGDLRVTPDEVEVIETKKIRAKGSQALEGICQEGYRVLFFSLGGGSYSFTQYDPVGTFSFLMEDMY